MTMALRFDFESVLREEDGGLLRAASGTLRHFLGEAARQGELSGNYVPEFAALRGAYLITSAMRIFELGTGSRDKSGKSFISTHAYVVNL